MAEVAGMLAAAHGTTSIWHHGAFVGFFAVFVLLMAVLFAFVVRFTIQLSRRRGEGPRGQGGSGRRRPLGPNIGEKGAGRRAPGSPRPGEESGNGTAVRKPRPRPKPKP